ncbi:MAG: TonB-dependent receptor plug domain-containing protein, partial [Hyphomicrobiaceae bacterium]|nr:TonB-dependent receptor plug domain-containing protein [Hyphomicrobiaceae bacterium]
MTTRRTATTINWAALALAGGVFTQILPAGVQAQDAQLADAELPPVVVEGATLEAAPVSTPKPKAKPKPQVVDSTDGPPPKQAKKAKNAPADDTAPPADDVGEVAGDIPDATSNGSAQTTANSDVSGVPASQLGTAVSVVTRAELKARQVRTAADALRSLPGVSVSQQGGRQNLTVVRIRGAESNQTLVLIDGVEVNAGSDGFFDFSNLMV